MLTRNFNRMDAEGTIFKGESPHVLQFFGDRAEDVILSMRLSGGKGVVMSSLSSREECEKLIAALSKAMHETFPE